MRLSIFRASMGDWSKKPSVPPPRPKATPQPKAQARVSARSLAQARVNQAVGHVANSVTRIEVDGLPVTVEQTGDAHSVEFAAQAEENGRKVKVAGQISYAEPRNLGGSRSKTCDVLADDERTGGTGNEAPYPVADAESWIRTKQMNGEEPDGEEEPDAGPAPTPVLKYQPQVWAVAPGKNPLGRDRKRKMRERIWELCEEVSAEPMPFSENPQDRNVCKYLGGVVQRDKD